MTAKTLKERAMDILARREHSREELYRKLSYKGFESDEVKAVIESLQLQGLLSDERYAESYVRSRAERGFGPLRIQCELKERGVDDTLIAQVISQECIDWNEKCRVVWKKKYNRFESFGSQAYAAQVRFLTQRGYRQEAIHVVLQSLTEECELFHG